MISVVIPYFQREAGVLRRALASVAAQVGVTMPVEVLVVDDASPMPADIELATMEWPTGFSARLIKRANGGTGAARNTGLDSVAVATEYTFIPASRGRPMMESLIVSASRGQTRPIARHTALRCFARSPM